MDPTRYFFRFFLAVTGGLIFWVAKGFRTTIEDELGDKYLVRNIATTLTILLVWLLIHLAGKDSDKKQYKRVIIEDIR